MSYTILLPLLGFFLSVALAAGAVATYVFRRSSSVDRRLRNLGSTATATAVTGHLDLKNASYGALQKYAHLLPKSHKELSSLRRRLAMAGFDRPEAAIILGFAEIALPVVLGVSALLYFGQPRGLIIALFLAAVGYMLPGLWLGHRTSLRRKQIQNGLPDALDLLLVSIEAGSGLDQAISKVSVELELAYQALAQEFRHVITEMRAGRPRVEALKQFAERTKVDDVRALVMTLVQTDKFGTSIAQALRTHAETARLKRRQRAEERAQKLGVKLVFPLVFFLFPAMYVVVLGPAALKIIRVLGSLSISR
jgi:tight adherence protein C